MKFKQNFKVIHHDTDINGIIYPSRILMFMQETAQGQLAMFGCAPDRMIKEENRCFWLTRISIAINAEIRCGDELEVITFPTNDSRGFSFNRCFEVYRGGELVASAYSVWALMNFENMRPIAVKDWDGLASDEDPIAPPAPLHIRIPRDVELCEAGSLTICYRDIDNNRHMNNSRYPDVLCGFIPIDELRGKRVSEISISFLHEAALGDTVTGVWGKGSEEDQIFFVRTLRNSDGSVNVEARVKLDFIGI